MESNEKEREKKIEKKGGERKQKTNKEIKGEKNT